MQVEDFPESCTSFIFSSLQIDETHTVTYAYEDVHNGNIIKLSKFLKICLKSIQYIISKHTKQIMTMTHTTFKKRI